MCDYLVKCVLLEAIVCVIIWLNMVNDLQNRIVLSSTL